MKPMLARGGKIMMAGEPIHSSALEFWSKGSCPYPWGIRLEAEVAAIVRFRKWYELGFQREFLISLFAEHGFSYHFRPGQISSYADVHEFIHDK